MSTTTINEKARADQGTYRWYRERVLNHLDSLQHGKLTVTDQYGTMTIGSQSADSLSVTIHIEEISFYSDAFWGGNLGVAEAYIKGKWTCDDLTAMLRLFCRNIGRATAMNEGLAKVHGALAKLRHWMSRNTISGSKKNIVAHYDLSNEFFELFLDPTMM